MSFSLVLLPHSYKDLFNYLLWRGLFWHTIWIFCHISPALWRFLPKSPISPKSPFSPKSPASKGPLLASNSNRQRLVIFRQFRHCMHGDFCQNRQFRQNRHFHQNRQPPRGHFWHPIQIARGWWFFAIACMAIFAKIANFAKIAIFAKIASGWLFFASFAIFAIACISGHKCRC